MKKRKLFFSRSDSTFLRDADKFDYGYNLHLFHYFATVSFNRSFGNIQFKSNLFV